MRRYRIVHTTALAYDGPIRAAHNELRMTPLNEPGQTTLENRIRIRPMTWSNVYRDHWGTHVMSMESLAEHERLDIEAISTVEKSDVEQPDPVCDWETVRDPSVQDRLYEWLMLSTRTRPGEGVAAIVDAVRDLPSPRQAADELCRRVRDEMTYRPGATGVHSSGEEAWADRAGVCQDFAHITIGALRSLGIPARYVSGYLAPRSDLDVGESASGESHAWVELWDDAWVPVDPTNGTPVGVEHVVVARGRDYEDVSPFKGVYSGRATAAQQVEVTMTRLA
ncbi:transglutaminase family protein [Phycicoccus sp. CSK15P-2]|uniref:transglutaminase family protein n=1 Tax=Phycicoccus sp. CSK15P-2 TaxID=2807627 RepID=UPI00194E64FF|nr:transglutaminase family protein [Phycicoccus sp. CSK15P-2]MBM6405016.1 transglutaminase family protein [Phycicoccus sp. CSK15P-2]